MRSTGYIIKLPIENYDPYTIRELWEKDLIYPKYDDAVKNFLETQPQQLAPETNITILEINYDHQTEICGTLSALRDLHQVTESTSVVGALTQKQSVPIANASASGAASAASATPAPTNCIRFILRLEQPLEQPTDSILDHTLGRLLQEDICYINMLDASNAFLKKHPSLEKDRRVTLYRIIANFLQERDKTLSELITERLAQVTTRTVHELEQICLQSQARNTVFAPSAAAQQETGREVPSAQP